MLQNKPQSFNDGVVKICEVDNMALDGDMPKNGLVLKRTMRYKERTVGLTRYYAALQASVRVQYVLRCQRLRDVSTQDMAIPNDGKQYRIVQVQYPEDVFPPVMDLTLEEVSAVYEIYQEVEEGERFDTQILQRFYVLVSGGGNES